MIIPKFGAYVKNGKLQVRNATAFNAYLWKFKEQDILEVSITKKKKNRSLDQNAWYWGGILPVLSHETGHTEEELHEIFKRKFLQRKIVKFRDKEYHMPGSTANLSVMDFSEYIERIIVEAAEMGIQIPTPDSYRS